MTQLFMTHPGPLPTAAGSGLEPRVATEADVPALARLLAAAYEEHWDIDRVRRDLTEAADVVVTWVVDSATRSGELSATASERELPDLYPGAGYLHWVAVSPDERGRSLGALVTRQAMSGFRDRGFGQMVLETDDFRAPAVITYLRLGFVPTYRNPAETLAWSQLFPTLLRSRSTVAGTPA